MNLTFEQAGFNVDSVVRFSSATEFVGWWKNKSIWPKLNEQQKNARLREIWELSKMMKNAHA